MRDMAKNYFNNYFVRSYICALVFFICVNSLLAINSDEEAQDFSEVKHVIKPRHIRIYSKPPGEDWGKQTGRNMYHHLDNALQGGTVGVEFDLKNLKEKFSGYMEKARKYLPFFRLFKKKPVEDCKNPLPEDTPPKDMPRSPSKQPVDDPDVDSNPRNEKSNEDDFDNEISMEFEIDPRRINAEPEDIVVLEREKLVN